jgi:hypothetical protein
VGFRDSSGELITCLCKLQFFLTRTVEVLISLSQISRQISRVDCSKLYLIKIKYFDYSSRNSTSYFNFRNKTNNILNCENISLDSAREDVFISYFYSLSTDVYRSTRRLIGTKVRKLDNKQESVAHPAKEIQQISCHNMHMGFHQVDQQQYRRL